ncbi:MAG: hypothetical protein M3541_10050 [Acidobacteriota bacterium]|nr:hypothetical protein [Acidobacteriota bacterium]MDQ3419110.1 hypothetical protein [Acidobacteriota bacterium]
MDLSIPGADLIERGLRDVARGAETVEALPVSIGAPRLRGLGLSIEHPFPSPERSCLRCRRFRAAFENAGFGPAV